ASPTTTRLDRTWWLLAVVPVVAAIAVGVTFAFTSSGTSTRGGGAHGTAVTIQNFAFGPPTLIVAPGATVTVSNADGTTHTFTAQGGAFDTGDLAGGPTTTFTAPAKAGTYAYRCNIHQYMHGVL